MKEPNEEALKTALQIFPRWVWREGNEAVANHLGNALTHKDWYVRERAAEALGQLGGAVGDQAERLLDAALTDTHAWVPFPLIPLQLNDNVSMILASLGQGIFCSVHAEPSRPLEEIKPCSGYPPAPEIRGGTAAFWSATTA